MKKNVICIAILAILARLRMKGCISGKNASICCAVRQIKLNGLIFFMTLIFSMFATQTHINAQNDEQTNKKLPLAVVIVGLESNQGGDFLATFIGNELNKKERYEVITRTGAVQKKLRELRESGNVNEDELIEWGRQNNVSRLCFVMSIKLDEHMFIAHLTDVNNNKLLGVGDYNSANLGSAELKKAAESLASQMLHSKEISAQANKDLVNAPRHPAEPEMVEVEGGTFTMGCQQGLEGCENDESPPHRVTVSSFYISKYEITQAQWNLIMGTTIRQQRNKISPTTTLFGEGDNYPMYYVSWIEVQEFILRLNYVTGKHYRLPTEAEWEYAAHGGKRSSGYKYSGSNNIYDVAWFADNSHGQNHPVGLKKANELGIHDMSGSVWEWCLDWYANYSAAPQKDPMGASTGSFRVFRGGGWVSATNDCRIVNRINSSDISRYQSVGFRIVLP
ncbi:MAG: formylglycine-generating enzyme family protein [Prevotellaceae bacterium]|jgi:formylglycine-generating enzyme required for sulfatase activity|nr:formylglycine-generating enzyme family protein [Prevotellaceae bacterium]